MHESMLGRKQNEKKRGEERREKETCHENLNT